ncbi:sugar transporter family protein [Aaosphaeria arxii CBS 175.79]|uniref:Sugar transporter family protein n=1 Tax=Aaosphaeria arxii CBS 175.79 TaxID=1450172 RepID=A0A6A5XVH2_9PLEO|nr:sugar transporter family protein [Aaosphaeria arxii CBS 175.79]KAF2016817.1 sugar transporter family protein [Aaosphaeria arxii CBS 175.79]
MGVGEYLATRFSSLKPPMTPVGNPFKQLRLLNGEQWNFFAVAWCGWVWDAFDFFTVSMTITQLAKDFGKKNSDITWGITLVLMLRSIGSFIFGLWSDRSGRKWPFIFNNILFIVLELATGFCKTYEQFLACRALFGIAMGGLYGNAVSTALEDSPPEARGILSGLFQAGYPAGYLLATAFSRALVDTTPHGWRPLFWFGACPPVLIIIWRMMMPENRSWRERESASATRTTASSFLREARTAVTTYWKTIIYMVVLMAGFNFMAHGSQDFYPTMLINQYQFTPNRLTVVQIMANLGAMSGAVTVGHLSEVFGRRLTIMVSCFLGGVLLYPYTFVSSNAVIASAFFLQFFMQGAFGVVPTYLIELSPDALRAFIVGTAYQLGNLASSPAATIQATIGEKYYPLSPTAKGVKRYDYAIVICAFLGACFALVIILAFLGPEKKGRELRGVAGDDLGDMPEKELSSSHQEKV